MKKYKVHLAKPPVYTKAQLWRNPICRRGARQSIWPSYWTDDPLKVTCKRCIAKLEKEKE